jgi:hypothetical protein
MKLLPLPTLCAASLTSRSPRGEPIDASATACDGHHKMSDFGAASELVHSGGEGRESV